MDMKLLPTHLRDLAADPVREGDLLTMTLRCPCGCTRFRLEEAVPSAAEQAAIDEWQAQDEAARKWHIVRMRTDEAGRKVLMRRHIFFGRWEPMADVRPEAPCYIDVLALRGVCRDCGRTHLIYDNRVHGFDALMGEYTGEAMAWQPQWKEIDLQALEVPEDARIRVDIPADAESSMEEMYEFIPGFTQEMACDAFGYLEVWSDVDGRRDAILFEAF